MNSLQAHLERYRAEHRTTGCRLTHMLGVPMIAAALPVLFFDWRWAAGLFIIGWALQFAGHRFFEHNRPVLLADPSNPLTYFSALIFVTQEWAQVLRGRGLSRAPSSRRPRD
jgi:uncharacterized membrane protein YGL010W